MTGVKINTLQIENTKKVKAFVANLEGAALTIVGGKNGAGKTSVLDAIAYALGGEKFRPGNVHREGSDAFPEIKLQLSNGLIVERSGKKSALKVTDAAGLKGGQRLLDEFVSAFALDIPRFRNATPKDKAAALLQVIGVGDELAKIEAEESRLYSERTDAGRAKDSAQKAVAEMPSFPDAPPSLLSVANLAEQHREAVARNTANGIVRASVVELAERGKQKKAEIEAIDARLAALLSELESAKGELAEIRQSYQAVKLQTEELVDIDPQPIIASMATAEDENAKVRANAQLAEAQERAAALEKAHAETDKALSAVRAQKAALLDNAKLPLPDLAVSDGELTYKGQPWDCMSGAEQLRVSTAIVRNLNPKCGFVLIDKIEEMDLDTLADFGAWLESEGLQAITTRVGTGEECSIVIENGTSR